MEIKEGRIKKEKRERLCDVDNCHSKGTLKTIIDFQQHFDSDL